MDADHVGPVAGVVCFALDQVRPLPSFQFLDGDAALLALGTAIHSIIGSDPDRRLVIEMMGGWRVYESNPDADAAVGADVIDLGGGVHSIGIDSWVDGTRIASIDDPHKIAVLIDALREAPFDAGATPAAEFDDFVSITFERPDGSASTRQFALETGVLAPGVQLPQLWIDTVAEALAESDVPIPPPPTTAPIVEVPPPTSSIPLDTPATTAQLAALAAAFAMPGEAEPVEGSPAFKFADGDRMLSIHGPILGAWQYGDLDAQSLPPATSDTAEATIRTLLGRIGIDPGDQVPSFTSNGPSVEVVLGGIIARVQEGGVISWAMGQVAAVPGS